MNKDINQKSTQQDKGYQKLSKKKPMAFLFYAQPRERSIEGFYFRTFREFESQLATLRLAYGDACQDLEIEFIQGGELDCELAKAWGINQANLSRFFEVTDQWSEEEKITFILAVRECGCSFDPDTVKPSDFDVSVYRIDTTRESAIQYIQEHLFDGILEHFQSYMDYDAIADDLERYYAETIVAGERLIYRCD